MEKPQPQALSKPSWLPTRFGVAGGRGGGGAGNHLGGARKGSLHELSTTKTSLWSTTRIGLPWRLKSKLGRGVLDATQLLDWRSDGVECRQSKIKKRVWPLCFRGNLPVQQCTLKILWQMAGPRKLQVRAHMWGSNWPYLSHLIGPSNKGLSMR